MDRLAEWIEGGMTHSEFVPIDALTHPNAKAALQFWAERPSDGIHIGRDVPSRLIARLLSHVTIYEPLPDGSDFKVHLAGSGIRHRFGRDITGETMAEIYSPEDMPVRFKTLQEVIATGEPRMTRITHRAGKVDVLKIELLQIPVVAPNGHDRWVLTFVFYF